jgi:hypothetical protein
VNTKDHISSAYQGVPSMSNLISSSQVINADTAECTLPSKKRGRGTTLTSDVILENKDEDEDDPGINSNPY